MTIKKILKFIDHALAPELCPICRDDIIAKGGDCCEKCAHAIKRPQHRCNICGGENKGFLEVCQNCLSEDVRPWFHGVTAFNYEGEIRNAIHRFKYSGQTYLAKFFGHQMAQAWLRHHELAEPEIIVPVPLHWRRRLARGYNQSTLVCNNLSKELGLPVVPGLKRKRSTGHQARKGSAQRHENLHRAFIADKMLVKGKEILLVDDVLTTGSTLAECTKALLEAGATDVSVLTIARD